MGFARYDVRVSDQVKVEIDIEVNGYTPDEAKISITDYNGQTFSLSTGGAVLTLTGNRITGTILPSTAGENVDGGTDVQYGQLAVSNQLGIGLSRNTNVWALDLRDASKLTDHRVQGVWEINPAQGPPNQPENPEATVTIEAVNVTVTIGGQVTSVFGRQGDVVAANGDYNLDQMGDVVLTTPAADHILKHNGANWINELGVLNSLNDVTINAPADGHQLQYNAGQWVNKPGAQGVITPTKTANYTANAGEIVPCDTSAGGFTVFLPAAPNTLDQVAIKKTSSDLNLLTVNANGNTLETLAPDVTAVSSDEMIMAGETVQLVWTGSVWLIATQIKAASGVEVYAADAIVGVPGTPQSLAWTHVPLGALPPYFFALDGPRTTLTANAPFRGMVYLSAAFGWSLGNNEVAELLLDSTSNADTNLLADLLANAVGRGVPVNGSNNSLGVMLFSAAQTITVAASAAFTSGGTVDLDACQLTFVHF